jgi:IstB-like ATP binding protein
MCWIWSVLARVERPASAIFPAFRGFLAFKADLLILDDWGPDRFTASQRRDLMEIVEDRYGAGSTLITSQLPVEAWHEVIGEPTFADAILDRIVHNAYRFALDAKARGGRGRRAGWSSLFLVSRLWHYLP